MKLLFSMVAATLLVAISSTAVLAEAFVYEPFDYTAGEGLLLQNGGTGFGTHWGDAAFGDLNETSPASIAAAGLNYTDGEGNQLVTSGGHAANSPDATAFRKFDMDAINAAHPELIFTDTSNYNPGFHLGKAGTTVWASFISRSNGNGGANTWGGISPQDGDANHDGVYEGGGKNFQSVFDAVNNGELIQFDPLPGSENFRTLTAFDVRGNFGSETSEGVYSLVPHRNGGSTVEDPGGAKVTAAEPSFVLLRFDFQVDPSNLGGSTGDNYYQDWPVDINEADTVRMWINPSLTTEPTDADSPAILPYESQVAFTGAETSGWPHSGEASQGRVEFIDRFDLKFDAMHFNARSPGAVLDEIRFGATFADVTPIVGGVDPINGDYDNDGFVGQSDLDLVLLNWGDTSPPAPAGWVNQVPTGLIGQGALDGVLLNWGNSASSQLVGVPEPSSALLFLLAVAAGGLSRKR